jgi:hypothetical protein
MSSAAPEGEPTAPGTSVIQGDGVSVSLPNSWVGAAHPSELPVPESDFAANLLQGYSDELTALYAFDGDRFLAIQDLQVHKAVSLAKAADLWAAEIGKISATVELVSRTPSTVDGHAAVRFVSTDPGSDTTLRYTAEEYVFPVGDTIWVVGWSTPLEGFAEAEPLFDRATESVRLTAE